MFCPALSPAHFTQEPACVALERCCEVFSIGYAEIAEYFVVLIGHEVRPLWVYRTSGTALRLLREADTNSARYSADARPENIADQQGVTLKTRGYLSQSDGLQRWLVRSWWRGRARSSDRWHDRSPTHTNGRLLPCGQVWRVLAWQLLLGQSDSGFFWYLLTHEDWKSGRVPYPTKVQAI